MDQISVVLLCIFTSFFWVILKLVLVWVFFRETCYLLLARFFKDWKIKTFNFYCAYSLTDVTPCR